MPNKYTQFEKENNNLISYMIEDRFFSRMYSDNYDYLRRNGLTVELYITSVCNQKCEYCYLMKYGDKLYPKKIRDTNKIIENIKILLNYFIERDLYIYDLDLFSGEIWGMEFGNRVFDTILEAIKNGLKVRFIMIPSNCTFVLNKKIKAVIQSYINKFKELGIDLKFSASVDGKILENQTRSYYDESANPKKSSDEFYKNLFNFCAKNGYGFHPMVSASGIEKWSENFDWWISNLRKYNMPINNFIMFLEVRNDDWTDEKIWHYLKFLNHVVDWFYLENYHKNIDKMIKDMFLRIGVGPQNYNIAELSTASKNPGCAIYRCLCVRMGDLSIVPCHRLSYDQFNYGKFIVDQGKITGIEAGNVQLANKILYTSTKCEHGCDVCQYNVFCMRGCHGSQFESTKDPLIPCKSVCNLFKSKFNFLIYKYEKMGILKRLKEIADSNVGVVSNMAKYSYNQINPIMESKEYQEWAKKMD